MSLCQAKSIRCKGTTCQTDICKNKKDSNQEYCKQHMQLKLKNEEKFEAAIENENFPKFISDDTFEFKKLQDWSHKRLTDFTKAFDAAREKYTNELLATRSEVENSDLQIHRLSDKINQLEEKKKELEEQLKNTVEGKQEDVKKQTEELKNQIKEQNRRMDEMLITRESYMLHMMACQEQITAMDEHLERHITAQSGAYMSDL